MATADSKRINQHQSAPEKDEDGDKCQICKKKFGRPDLLPCFYTFRQKCLQGVAGTFSTSPCPTCRTPVTPPDQKMGQLPTNIHVKDNLWLCYARGEEKAAHVCVECQQKHCPDHSDMHSKHGGRRETMVPVASKDGEEKCGTGSVEGVKMCAKHRDQLLLLHCSTCQADICIECQVTQHRDHPSQYLTDANSTKGKFKHTVNPFEDQCRTLQEQTNKAEGSCRARAKTLHEWVDLSLDEAVQALQSSLKQLNKPWEDHDQQQRCKAQELQGNKDHIQRVLNSGEETALEVLLDQFKTDIRKDIVTDEVKSELPNDIPNECTWFLVKNDPDAVNHLQLKRFIGQPKKLPCEFPCSNDHRYSISDICPISRERLWVLCWKTECNGCPPELKLFDADGQLLTAIEYTTCALTTSLLSIAEDVLMTWGYENEKSISVELVSPDGNRTPYAIVKRFTQFVSNDLSDAHYYLAKGKGLMRIKFSFDYGPASTDQTVLVAALPGSSETPSPSSSAQLKHVTHACSGPLWKDPPSQLTHVSTGGTYLACTCVMDSNMNSLIGVYSMSVDKSESPDIIGYYSTAGRPLAIRFCVMDGHEMLLVVAQDDHRVHVVDIWDQEHRERSLDKMPLILSARYLDTRPLTLHNPCCLAIDLGRRIWIGCQNGKVVMVDI